LNQIIINIPSAASRLAGNVRTNKTHILNDQRKCGIATAHLDGLSLDHGCHQ